MRNPNRTRPAFSRNLKFSFRLIDEEAVDLSVLFLFILHFAKPSDKRQEQLLKAAVAPERLYVIRYVNVSGRTVAC